MISKNDRWDMERPEHRTACRFSLSPQRGEGRGEGWERSEISGTAKIARLITPHPQSLSPLRGEGSSRRMLIAIRQGFNNCEDLD